MIGFDEACAIFKKNFPNKRIYQVAELPDWYQFWSVYSGERVGPMTFVVDTPIVYKDDGRIDASGTALDTARRENEIVKWHDLRRPDDWRPNT